jgi:molybdenum cofactor cytidylyltransferase
MTRSHLLFIPEQSCRSVIAAVVLAAGKSTRMGRTKQVLRIGQVTMLQKVMDTYRLANVDKLVVVLGADAGNVRKGVKFRDETVVVNERFEDGMSGSIRAGVAAVPKDAEAALIALGDQPTLRPGTIDRIVEEYKATGAPIVVPVYHGQRGNPVLFHRSVFPQLMRLEGDVGAKSVVRTNERGLREVAVEDSGILFDVDTPEDYHRANAGGGNSRRTRNRE